VGAQQEETDVRSLVSLLFQILHRQDIAQGTGHLLAVDHHQLRTQPVVGHPPAGGRLADGQDVFAVGKGDVGATGMDVEGVAQILQGDGGAFQMPTGPDASPAGLVVNPLLQFTQGRAFQEGEIHRAVFFIIIEIAGPAVLDFAQVNVGKFPVITEFGNIEINGAEFFVGVALAHQFFHHPDHIVHMFAGPGIHLIPLDIQLVDVPEKCLGAAGGVAGEIRAGPLGAPDRTVRQIHDIRHMLYLIALEFQIPAQEIGNDEAAVAADVGHVMNRGAAGVDPDLFGAQGLEEFLLPRQGVVEAQRRFSLFREQIGAQVTLAAVRKNDHHDAAVQFPGLLEGHMHGGAGAHAHEQALLAGQTPGGRKSVFIENIGLFVQQLPVEYPGTVGFLHVLEPLDLMLEIGLDPDNPDRGIVLLETPGDPHGGSRRSQGHDHHGYRPCGLAPDLRRRAFVMGPDIVRVVELIRPEILARRFPHHEIGRLDGAVRTQVGRGEVQLGAHGLQDLLSFLAGRFRHGQAETIALGGGHQGQANARVAAGRLQNDLVLCQFAPRFGALDHGQGRPVLYGTAGIEAFHLGQDFHAGIVVEAAYFHQRRVADRSENIDAGGFHGWLNLVQLSNFGRGIFRKGTPSSRRASSSWGVVVPRMLRRSSSPRWIRKATSANRSPTLSKFFSSCRFRLSRYFREEKSPWSRSVSGRDSLPTTLTEAGAISASMLPQTGQEIRRPSCWDTKACRSWNQPSNLCPRPQRRS